MANILLVEDDADISGPLLRVLGREGYGVVLVETGREALEALTQAIDLVILDLGLPDMDGVDVARHIRSHGLEFPILILTARSEEVDMVVGLDAGADDYMIKPFRLAELLARVRALLRRLGRVELPIEMLRGQDIAINTEARRAFRAGEELSLTTKEFELLEVLIRNAGAVVSRDELLAEVWGEEAKESTKKLDMHISWLRRKLGDPVESPRYISTVRGTGFRFERD